MIILTGNEKIRYRVGIENVNDYIAIPVKELVNAGEEKLIFEKGRYWCKVLIGEKETCSVQGIVLEAK